MKEYWKPKDAVTLFWNSMPALQCKFCKYFQMDVCRIPHHYCKAVNILLIRQGPPKCPIFCQTFPECPAGSNHIFPHVFTVVYSNHILSLDALFSGSSKCCAALNGFQVTFICISSLHSQKAVTHKDSKIQPRVERLQVEWPHKLCLYFGVMVFKVQ